MYVIFMEHYQTNKYKQVQVMECIRLKVYILLLLLSSTFYGTIDIYLLPSILLYKGFGYQS